MAEATVRKTKWYRLFVWSVGVYLGMILLLRLLENKLVYHPVRDTQSWYPPPAGVVVEDVWVQTVDGARIHGWWFPRPATTNVLLYCHGNAGNLSHRGPFVPPLMEALDTSVLVFDYPAYGKSAGQVSEAGCYAAADAMYDWLTQVQHVAPERILLYGKSLGGGVATDLAARRSHRALILCKSFTSVPDVGQTLYPLFPVRWLARNQFNSLEKLGSCPGPVAIAHGDRDELIPRWMAEQLYEAAPPPKRFFLMKGCGHNDPPPIDVLRDLAAFLHEHAR